MLVTKTQPILPILKIRNKLILKHSIIFLSDIVYIRWLVSISENTTLVVSLPEEIK